jgi:hypothetical protein
MFARPLSRHLLTAVAAALVALPAADLAAQGAPAAQTPESEAETRARLARRGAGLTVGSWDLRGLEPPSGVEVSTMPLISGWMRRGLDARLSLENGIGVWRRVQTVPPSGGLGGSSGEEVQSWVIAQTTAIRLFPFTDAGARFEPFVLGAAGFTLGIDDRGVSMVPGVSLQGGAGAEWHFAESFGLTAGARFQWTRFFQDFGGERTYQGPVYEVGLSYKFRYR